MRARAKRVNRAGVRRKDAPQHSPMPATPESTRTRNCRFLVTNADSFFRDSRPVSAKDVSTVILRLEATSRNRAVT